MAERGARTSSDDTIRVSTLAHDPRPCRICGDEEPHHVHHNGHRIEDYFTVGRGQSDFQAALSWQRRYFEAKREATASAQLDLDALERLNSFAPGSPRWQGYQRAVAEARRQVAPSELGGTDG